VQVERTRCNRNVRANVRSGLLRNESTRNGNNERKVRRWQRKERAGQGVVLKDVRPGLSFSQVLSAILVANIVTRLFPAQTPPPTNSTTKHQVSPGSGRPTAPRNGSSCLSLASKPAWRTCRIRVPSPLKTQASKPARNPVVESDAFCLCQPQSRPAVIKCDGRSRAFALLLARRFDVSRCARTVSAGCHPCSHRNLASF